MKTEMIEPAQHNTFGGKIYRTDFDSSYIRYPGTIASRIASDLRFDEMCRTLAIAREKYEAADCIERQVQIPPKSENRTREKDTERRL